MAIEDKFMLFYNAGWAAVALAVCLYGDHPLLGAIAFYVCWYHFFFKPLRKEHVHVAHRQPTQRL